MQVVVGGPPVRVHLNVAVSLDGKIALPGGAPLALSDAPDLRRVHGLRQTHDAILVGVGTVLADDPSLLTKAEFLPAGEVPQHPTRVVLDTHLRAPADARVFDGRASTIVCVREGVTGTRANADIVPSGKDRVTIPDVLGALEARGIRSVLVEGGAHVIASFLRARCVDRMTIYVAPVFVGDRAPSLVQGWSATGGGDAFGLRLVKREPLGAGVLMTLEPDG